MNWGGKAECAVLVVIGMCLAFATLFILTSLIDVLSV